jgi:hypothetical protein
MPKIRNSRGLEVKQDYWHIRVHGWDIGVEEWSRKGRHVGVGDLIKRRTK